MHEILQDIINHKRRDVALLKKVQPLAPPLATPKPAAFYPALNTATATPIIAEIKLASPTHQNLGNSNDIVERAKEYQASGASAISFITEQHYFKSNSSFIPLLKQSTALPILQKDFVIDEYQIYEAATIGSDALLLIARLVDSRTLQHFVKLTQQLGIEPVVEVNNRQDIAKALATSTRCIAVNARNLETFTVNLVAACELISTIPDHYLRFGFSGIHSRQDVQQYIANGANAVLVGTSLMQTRDIRQKIQELQS